MSCSAKNPCFDYSGMPSGTEPISVLRTGKDVMPFRQGSIITTYMGDYIPPVVMPGYLGHLPGVSTSCGSTFGGATQKYFRMYRQELLGRQVRPKMVFGRFPCDFTPFPDVAAAGRAISTHRICDTPNIRSPGVDFNRRLELFQFYDKCQRHRDYYLDKSGKVLPQSYFYVGSPWPIRCPSDEREFKIRRAEDACDKPAFLGPSIYCAALPCVSVNGGIKRPFAHPELGRSLLPYEPPVEVFNSPTLVLV